MTFGDQNLGQGGAVNNGDNDNSNATTTTTNNNNDNNNNDNPSLGNFTSQDLVLFLRSFCADSSKV